MFDCVQLVGNKIVSLDLPVRKMYRRWLQDNQQEVSPVVAQVLPGGSIRLISASGSVHTDEEDDKAEEEHTVSGSASGSAPTTVLLAGDMPMSVTYRLTGLDGEATEEV